MRYFRKVRGTAVTRPGWTAPKIMIVLLAIAFYVLIAALAAAGVWLVLFDFPNFTIILGLLLLGIAAVLAPRFGRLGADGDRISRDEAPTLFGLVDRVAAAAGTGAPNVIELSADINASASAVGLRRRRVLHLGLALWGPLSAQQRVALLGHELGHFANGDVRRLVLTQPALTTLGGLADLFMPDPGLRSYDLVAVGERLANAFLRIVAAVFWALHLVVTAVALRDFQRAEYFADQIAVRVAGTQAATELSDLLVWSQPAGDAVAVRARAGETEQGWRMAVGELRSRMAPRQNRLRQLSVRHEVSLLATHPPSGMRAWLVEAAPWRDPALVLGDAENERIDTELSKYYQRYRRDIAHNWQ